MESCERPSDPWCPRIDPPDRYIYQTRSLGREITRSFMITADERQRIGLGDVGHEYAEHILGARTGRPCNRTSGIGREHLAILRDRIVDHLFEQRPIAAVSQLGPETVIAGWLCRRYDCIDTLPALQL